MTISPGLAAASSPVADQAAGLVVERGVDAEDVGARHDLVEAAHPLVADGEFGAVREIGVVEDHLHVEGRRAARRRQADAAEAEDARRWRRAAGGPAARSA